MRFRYSIYITYENGSGWAGPIQDTPLDANKELVKMLEYATSTDRSSPVARVQMDQLCGTCTGSGEVPNKSRKHNKRCPDCLKHNMTCISMIDWQPLSAVIASSKEKIASLEKHNAAREAFLAR